MFAIVAQNLISLCLLMAIGFTAGKLKIINEKLSRGLGDVLLYIAMPCTIVMSMQRSFTPELLMGGLMTLGISVIIYMSAFGAGLLLTRLLRVEGHKSRIWVFAAVFANVGYMGFPVMRAVFGEDILFYVSMNNVVFNVLSTTLGIAVMTGAFSRSYNINRKRKMQLPYLPAVTLAAFLMFAFSIVIPAPIANALTMGGNMMTPLAMIIIGAILARSELLKLFKGWKDYVLVSARLIIFPCLVLLMLKLFSNILVLDIYIQSTAVLLTGMPIAAVTAVYAAKFTDEAEDDSAAYASKLIAMSTVLSLVTLPLIAVLAEVL
jgi:hypothetical protein